MSFGTRQNGRCSSIYSPVEKGAYTGKGVPLTKRRSQVKGEKVLPQGDVTITSDRPPTRLADVYGSWATSENNASLVAALTMCPTRLESIKYFYRQFNEFNKDPEQILNSMLTGKPGAQKI